MPIAAPASPAARSGPASPPQENALRLPLLRLELLERLLLPLRSLPPELLRFDEERFD
jgi:hypothetical protein